MGVSEQRLALEQKIKNLEKERKFDVDVMSDPPYEPIKPGQVDYLRKKISSKIKNKWCKFLLSRFIKKQIKQNKGILKEIVGLEKVKDLKTGAIVTSNHFHPFDSYPILQMCKKIKKKEYVVIAEKNWAGGQGFYGFVFRNNNTIPLAQNPQVMKECIGAINHYLKKGNFVLVYGEQAMWLNYRKPRPIKEGAFRFAIKANVPVVACFVTMNDSEFLDDDGFPVQEWTLHILDVIYPKKELSLKENVQYMKQKNEQLTKQKYEEVYKTNLIYES